MNPLMILVATAQVGACIWEFARGSKQMAFVYLCYAISSVILTYIAYRITHHVGQ